MEQLVLGIEESDSINILKERLKRLYGPNKSKKLYSHGHGWPTVNHCRIRLGLSHLKRITLYNQLIAKM